MLAPKDLTPMRETAPPPTLESSQVTEDTNLNDLTPQQISELTQSFLDSLSDSTSTRPLISPLAPISVLHEEYESPNFRAQIARLESQGYRGIARTRGDGDCFYRSIAYAYISNLISSTDPPLSSTIALSTLSTTPPLLVFANFQPLVYEDFYDVLMRLVSAVANPTPEMGREGLSKERLLEAFQDAETSNSIVMYLRLLTSAQIRNDPSTYEPFLVHPELNIPLEVGEFCVGYVEAVGKEADHVQVAALSRALRINVQVAYLDGRSSDGHVDFVPFANNEDTESIRDIILLYRPGHYDVLERDLGGSTAAPSAGGVGVASGVGRSVSR